MSQLPHPVEDPSDDLTLHLSKKQKMVEMYNNASYTEIYDQRYLGGQTKKLQYLWQHFTPFSGLLLDLGCGTGLAWDIFHSGHDPYQNTSDNNQFIKNAIPSFRFIGLDLARGMLERFYKKNTPISLHTSPSEGPHLICADGEHLPFRDFLFDASISLTTLQNLPNLDQGLHDFKRVMRCSDSQIGISFLKKSLPEEELYSQLRTNFQDFCLIPVDIPSDEYCEDWLVILHPHK